MNRQWIYFMKWCTLLPMLLLAISPYCSIWSKHSTMNSHTKPRTALAVADGCVVFISESPPSYCGFCSMRTAAQAHSNHYDMVRDIPLCVTRSCFLHSHGFIELEMKMCFRHLWLVNSEKYTYTAITKTVVCFVLRCVVVDNAMWTLPLELCV